MSILAVVLGCLLSSGIPALAASPAPSGHQHAGGGVNLDSPAARLRVDLDRLLAEHAFLTIEQMRSGLGDSPDFAAAAGAVEANSTEIVDAIGSIYGDAAKAPFGDIWRSHVGYLVDYAQGLRAADAAARQQALMGLADYRAALATFLGDANPGVDLAGIVDALDMHTAQMVELIDLVHEGDHTGAYALQRDGYHHMFEIGDALARVIANRFSDQFTGLDVAYSPAGSLRVTLDRLLAEHAFLAAEAMRAGIAEEAHFEAATAALDANSVDLAAVVAAAYGAEAGAAFRALWDGHDAAYIAYIEATGNSDEAARTTALGQLEGYTADLGSFLASANPHLDAAGVTTLFAEHAAHLTSQVDAFQAKDYDGTYARVREGYRHMFAAGEALAVGIATQLPDEFPTTAEPPATDIAPSHAHARDVELAVFAASIGLLLFGLWALTRIGEPASSRAGRRLPPR